MDFLNSKLVGFVGVHWIILLCYSILALTVCVSSENSFPPIITTPNFSRPSTRHGFLAFEKTAPPSTASKATWRMAEESDDSRGNAISSLRKRKTSGELHESNRRLPHRQAREALWANGLIRPPVDKIVAKDLRKTMIRLALDSDVFQCIRFHSKHSTPLSFNTRAYFSRALPPTW